MRTRCAALLLLAATARATPLTKLRAKLVPKPKQSIALDQDAPSPKSLRRDNAAAVATVEALIDERDPRWTQISEDGARTKVWKRNDNEKHECVLAKGIIDAPPDKVYAPGRQTSKRVQRVLRRVLMSRFNEHMKSLVATKNFGPSVRGLRDVVPFHEDEGRRPVRGQ